VDITNENDKNSYPTPKIFCRLAANTSSRFNQVGKNCTLEGCYLDGEIFVPNSCTYSLRLKLAADHVLFIESKRFPHQAEDSGSYFVVGLTRIG
jgi:hypothetical protein